MFSLSFCNPIFFFPSVNELGDSHSRFIGECLPFHEEKRKKKERDTFMDAKRE